MERRVCKSVLAKPNIKQHIINFFVKTRVHAFIKNIFYSVYVHLDQETGEKEYSKCLCKARQCGCCKQAAALLITFLDYTNIELKSIPATLTCNQVAQKWHEPLLANNGS